MRQNIPLEVAQAQILSCCTTGGTEIVPLTQSFQRVLAEEVVAAFSIPPFDRSPLDGYALRSIDCLTATRSNPVRLKVVDNVSAGRMASCTLEPGTAIRVMTGAPVPGGADTVVRQEDTLQDGEDVLVYVAPSANSNIARAGEDVREGEMVLQPGCRLHSGAVGMLAALGKDQVRVYQKPRVAILSTGEELVDLGVPLGPGQIYNSNLYALVAAVREAGGEPIAIGTFSDSTTAIAAGLAQALDSADLVITTGGASVGEYDLVREAFLAVGAEILFWRIKIKPGTPAVLARRGKQALLGLSGNPAAALITFELLGRPAILQMSGRRDIWRPRVQALLEEDYAKNGGARRFLRATVRWEGGYRASISGRQTPGVLKSILYCNALVDVPAGSSGLKAGEMVDVILLMESGEW